MSFPAQEAVNSCFLQTCGCVTINNKLYQYKYIVGALLNSWVAGITSNTEISTQPHTLAQTHVEAHKPHMKESKLTSPRN
jgi:hypothetical protein